jgi:hypothetical protein
MVKPWATCDNEETGPFPRKRRGTAVVGYNCRNDFRGAVTPMLMGLSFTPGLAIAGLTTSVSLAAAMTGVQALGPVATHTPAAVVAHVAVPAHGAPAVAHLASANAHAAKRHLLADNPVTSTPASPTCTTSQLPSQANGVGRRCVSAPPSSVPGKGHPAGGTSNAPQHAAQPQHPATPASSKAGGNASTRSGGAPHTASNTGH